MQITTMPLTCVVSSGEAFLFCDGRIVWHGEPSAVRAVAFDEAARLVEGHEKRRAELAKEERNLEYINVFRSFLHSERDKERELRKHDHWDRRLAGIARSIHFRFRAGLNSIARSKKGSGQRVRPANCSWEYGLRLALSSLISRMNWRGDKWQMWAVNLLSNMRKRSNRGWVKNLRHGRKGKSAGLT